jgi:hypothetical protein
MDRTACGLLFNRQCLRFFLLSIGLHLFMEELFWGKISKWSRLDCDFPVHRLHQFDNVCLIFY